MFHEAHVEATRGMIGGLLCPRCFERFAGERVMWLAVPYSQVVSGTPREGEA